MSIFRAKMPKRKFGCSKKELFNQRTTFKTLSDELYNDALLCICAVNNKKVQNPLLPKNSKYVFAICKNKPINSDIFKWEEMGELVKKSFVITNIKSGRIYKRKRCKVNRDEKL